MSKAAPVPIGQVAEPPFVRLPDPPKLFGVRGERLRALADGHRLQPYLMFLAGLCEAQHEVQDGLPEPELPAAETRGRARQFAMPPLDRERFTADAALDATFDRMLRLLRDIEMPPAAGAALARVIAADRGAREAMVHAVLACAIPIETMAEHVYAAAAVQVHFARLAARLDAAELVAVGDGACPACGGPPVASLVVGWPDAHGTRFCSCALCATLWNHVRIKCTLCGSIDAISYQEIDGGPGTVKAETCGSCHGYLKILHQHKDPALEPVADDVATLGLDLLVREAGFRRGGFDPFLLGY